MLTPFNILAGKLFKDVYQPNFKTLYSYPFVQSILQSRAQSLVAGDIAIIGVGVDTEE